MWCSLKAFLFLSKGSKPSLRACHEGCQTSSTHTRVQRALTAERDHIAHSLTVNIKIFCQRFPFHSAITGNKWNFWRFCKAESCISHFCQSFYKTQNWWQPTCTKDETPNFSPKSLNFSVPKAAGCLSVLYQTQNAYFWVTKVKRLCKFTWSSSRNNFSRFKLIAAVSFLNHQKRRQGSKLGLGFCLKLH